jgi:SAM-dependent MidA family methyltransferase
LIELIRAEIQKRGPVSFAWFMEQALYHSEHGYYSSGRCAIGRHGDFFTNVSVGPLFGRLLTAQIAEMWERLGQPKKFVVAEQGADNGDFARDLLESARKFWPDFFAALRYRIIEPLPILRGRQSQTLAGFGEKIEWDASLDSLNPFVGVHFSNELLDSMPVRLVSHSKEKLVDLEGEDFVFVERAVRDGGEFNQVALEWVESVATKLQRGYVLAIDYGHVRREFQGIVQVRAQHRHLDSPFQQIGYADITMHVDWRSIARRAQANGLHLAGFADQHHFLSGIISELGGDDWGQSHLPEIGTSPKMKRELQTLLHPEMLGRSFQVLALAKNVDPCSMLLAGFKFAREPSYALDL